MNPSPASAKLTYEDLRSLPDDGKRHELIDGEHYVTPSPGATHQLIVGNLYYLLRDYLQRHPIGFVMVAPFDIVLTNIDVVEPDLIYFTRRRFTEVVGAGNARGAPELAVEILSPTTRRKDEITKRKLYEREGIAEYWVVDPELETIKTYRLAGSTYGRPEELALERRETLTSPLFPDLVVPLDQVFALPDAEGAEA